MVSEDRFIGMQNRLAADACSLATGRRLPIDVLELLRDLGVGLTIEKSQAVRRVGALRRAASGWEVLLLRKGQEPSGELLPRERFTIAHELGHYLIAARFGFKPNSNREYWRLEEICNDFARFLLAPQAAVEAVVHHEPASAFDLLSMADTLASMTRLSLEPASRRLVSSITSPAFLGFLQLPSNRPQGEEGRLLWLVQNRPWTRVGRFKKIGESGPLASVLFVAQNLDAGGTREIALAGAEDAWIHRRGDYAALAGLMLRDGDSGRPGDSSAT